MKLPVVDGGHAVAGAEDDVDEVLAAPRLAEPVRKRQLRLAPGRGQHREHPLDAYTVEQLDRYQKTWEVLA